MSQVISLRLPDETAERLRRSARRAGRTINELGVLSVEEWLRQNEFADIEFRSFGAERHACMKRGMPIWQLIMVAKEYEMDAARTAEHFQWPIHRVKAAFNYYEVYPQEIDQAIEDNEAVTPEVLKRLLPQLHVTDVG